jgi:hypothetical protein
LLRFALAALVVTAALAGGRIMLSAELAYAQESPPPQPSPPPRRCHEPPVTS